MRYRITVAALLAAACSPIGCGPSGRVQERSIEVKENSGLEQAKQLLNNYAKGQPLGSETTSFAYIVEEVRKTDPARATILEQGFAELQKPKAKTAAKAKELLKRLEPKQTAG